MSAQAYANLIQPMCGAAERNEWNEVDSLKRQLDDLLDSAMFDAGIGLSEAGMNFLSLHGAIETARIARQPQALCGAAIFAVNALTPPQPQQSTKSK